MDLELADGFLDFNFKFLVGLCELLDERLTWIQTQCDGAVDPDAMGLIDDFEYYSGLGFVACQRYLTATCQWCRVEKRVALAIGPHHDSGQAIVTLLNAAANYWKHVDDWNPAAVARRDVEQLHPRQQRTIHVIQTVTPWSDYTCANLLGELTAQSRFVEVMPVLEVWRERVSRLGHA